MHSSGDARDVPAAAAAVPPPLYAGGMLLTAALCGELYT